MKFSKIKKILEKKVSYIAKDGSSMTDETKEKLDEMRGVLIGHLGEIFDDEVKMYEDVHQSKILIIGYWERKFIDGPIIDKFDPLTEAKVMAENKKHATIVNTIHHDYVVGMEKLKEQYTARLEQERIEHDEVLRKLRGQE